MNAYLDLLDIQAFRENGWAGPFEAIPEPTALAAGKDVVERLLAEG